MVLQTSRLFTLFLLMFIFTSLQAQQEYEWEEYNIGFEVESDFRVDVNNSDEFTAISSDDEITITILPWKDRSIDEDDLADIAMELAVEMEYDAGDDIEGDKLEIEDFKGYYVYLGQQDASSVNVVFAVLLNNTSSTNLIIAIQFEKGNDDEVVELMKILHTLD